MSKEVLESSPINSDFADTGEITYSKRVGGVTIISP